LFALVATNQQQHQLFASTGLIDAISRPVIYAQFPNAISKGLAIAKIAGTHALQTHQNARPRLAVYKFGQPFFQRVASIFGQLVK